MLDEDNFRKAMDLLLSGRRKESSVILLDLYKRAVRTGFRLQLIDALSTALDPIKENQELIDMTSEGIKLAGEMRMPTLQAHFMGRKAEFLMTKVSQYQYQRANIKLAPGWIEFSTEVDKNSYESFTKKIEELDKEIDQLLADAVSTTKKVDDKKGLAFVLMSKASIESSRYLQYKMECIRGTWRAKIWLFFHKLGFDIMPFFNPKHFKILRTYVKSFTENYLEAARLLKEIGDSAEGYAYFDLAVHLMTAYKFRKAMSYINQAKAIAGKYNDTLLLVKAQALEKSIRTKNKDMPNYLEGETREEIVV